MSFSNSYKHTIDSKKRLFIPAKFRAKLGESFYLYYDESRVLPFTARRSGRRKAKSSRKAEMPIGSVSSSQMLFRLNPISRKE